MTAPPMLTLQPIEMLPGQLLGLMAGECYVVRIYTAAGRPDMRMAVPLFWPAERVARDAAARYAALVTAEHAHTGEAYTIEERTLRGSVLEAGHRTRIADWGCTVTEFLPEPRP